MLENALNLRATKIYDTIYDENGKEQHKLNGPATEEAQAKQRMIEDAFKDWIFNDRERRERLVALYNEKFNCIRPREYDGSHIQFFGMNPEIALRPHQRNAIAHILYGHNTLLAHVVGAGKTYEMVAAAMEKKRLGLCSKTLVAVPNHLTGQFASEALKLYPNANILVTTQRDFEKTNRKRFCAKIATGNYDIVVIGHSQFEKIPLSDARKAEFIRKQIDELEIVYATTPRMKGVVFMKKSIVALGIVLALSGCAAAADETLAAEPAALVEISPATEETAQPVEAAATAEPAQTATPAPTPEPTQAPTPAPTAEPTAVPTAEPTQAPVEETIAATPAQISMSYGAVPFDLAAGTEQWWSIDSSDSAYWAVQENINAIRAAAGLSPLAMDGGLSAAADARCESFVAGGAFDHSGMTTRSEICAAGPIGSASSVCSYWQNSPAHYANITNASFTSMGVACWFCSTVEGQYTYWTVTFN